ncbi:MAG: hypothetical protein L7V86_02635 [Verrucomicrobiales bacterium]|nr:hypothetical protein [Verrucomicrobiales bacterium]
MDEKQFPSSNLIPWTKSNFLAVRAQGQLPWPTLLRCRVRYLTDSQVIGSKEFLDEVFARNRKDLKVTREEGARCPRSLRLGDDWRTLTDLPGDVVL